MKRKYSLDYLFVTFFFSGYIKFAPGTWGTLAGLIFWVLIPISSFYMKLLLIVATFITGLLVSGTIERKREAKDPGYIVIDEVVGIWITLMFLPQNPPNYYLQLALAFLLFRLFDISKIPPIKYCEKLKGGTGIMVDDVVAGIFAGIVLLGLNQFVF